MVLLLYLITLDYKSSHPNFVCPLIPIFLNPFLYHYCIISPVDELSKKHYTTGLVENKDFTDIADHYRSHSAIGSELGFVHDPLLHAPGYRG